MAGAPTWGPVEQKGPVNWDVQANQTVAGQLEKIIANDSPLMQQARTRALQTAQANGRSNSSMAASAGDAAMYDAAMPIAQQDASTFGNAGQINANAGNTFNLASNAFNRDKAMADFNLGANEWAAGKAFGRNEQAADANFGRSETAADRAYVVAHPETRQMFIDRFGVAP